MSEQKIEPKPGDLIWADRSIKGLPYNHCGIYEGGGMVIHFASPEGSEINQENAVVHETTFEHFKDGCPVKIINIKGSLPVEETLRQAREHIGIKGYDFTTFNCDHFATWCKTGKQHSIQADEIKDGLRQLNNPIADIVCDVHDVVEMIKAPRLDTVYPVHENEINDNIETNSIIQEAIPFDPEDKDDDISAEYSVMDDEDDDSDEEGDLPPEKKPWYEKAGEILKGITYPVSIGLEFLKKRIPILRPIPVMFIAAKVRNVIDNVVTAIKVFTGKITPEQANEERLNNETALAGSIIKEKQTSPIAATLQNVFGKIGSVIKHAVQYVAPIVVSPKVREAIKTGARIVKNTVVSGIKSFVQRAKQGVQTFVAGFRSIKKKIFG